MQSILQSLASKMLSRSDLKVDIRQLLIYLQENDVSERSVWHPLGFVLLKLGLAGSYGNMRLHIWPRTERRPQSPYWAIHNHSWSLKSYIICGEAANDLYRINPTENNGHHQLYSVEYEKNSSVLNATGVRVSCSLLGRMTHLKGEYYDVLGDQYHSTRVAEGTLTSTLVLTADTTCAAPAVVGDFGGRSKYEYERAICNHSQFVSFIDQLRSQTEKL